MSLNEFRADAKNWLDEHCPESLRGSIDAVSGGGHEVALEDADKRQYFDAMVERGRSIMSWMPTLLLSPRNALERKMQTGQRRRTQRPYSSCVAASSPNGARNSSSR